jgi:hypothetical protein
MRKTDQNRAVLCAQNWLLKTQSLERYFGITYNMYEIQKQDADGVWHTIEIGDVNNAETGWANSRQAREEAQERSVPQVVGGTQGSGKARKGKGPAWGTLGLGPTVGHQTTQRRRASLSPLQQRIADAQALAKQVLAEKKARDKR